MFCVLSFIVCSSNLCLFFFDLCCSFQIKFLREAEEEEEEEEEEEKEERNE